ncbi:MAG: ABC transporter substrate-binding protein [Firmicutes bacterium]|jgi:peptide/nickel transport system substrate-binding protein|nr:ABC transporter substrate-binding protein [Bacillota bacterium]
MKKRFISAIALLIVTAMLFGCNQAPTPAPDPGSEDGGKTTLTIGSAYDIISLVPFLSTDSPSGDVHTLIHEGLIGYVDNYEMIPKLAETWETSEDGKTWTFYLREGVTFHDGSEFTAADVKFTFEQILDPAIKSNHYKNYEVIESIETPDDFTVVFNLNKPFAPFLDRMNMGIVSKTYVEAQGFNENNYNGYNLAPVGTGPWILNEWMPETSLTLDVNADYWGTVPTLEKVIFKPIPEASVRLISFENHEVDYIQGISPDDVNRLAESDKFTIFTYPQLRFAYLAWNNQYEVFKDKALRQALAYATDKETLIASILNGFGVNANTTYAPNHSYYHEVPELYGYDPAKATSILDEAGYIKGDDGIYVSPSGVKASFETMVTSNDEVFTQIALLLRQWFKDIGVEMNIKTMEKSAMYDIMDRVILDGAPDETYQSMIGSMGPTSDPDQIRYLHSDGGLNDYRYMNEKVDALLEAGLVESDSVKRAEIYKELQEYIAEDLPMLYLYFTVANNAMASEFEGMNPSPYGQLAALNLVKGK